MEEELLELEDRFWRAGGDPAFYRDHFADEGRCVFPFGVLDKLATMSSIQEATPWVEIEFVEVSVLDLGAETRALIYQAEAVDDEGFEYTAAVSSVYVRRDGRWQLALHQQSPAPPPPG